MLDSFGNQQKDKEGGIMISLIVFLIDWLVVLGYINTTEDPSAGIFLCMLTMALLYVSEVLR